MQYTFCANGCNDTCFAKHLKKKGKHTVAIKNNDLKTLLKLH